MFSSNHGYGHVWFTAHQSQARRREEDSLGLGQTHARSQCLVPSVNPNRLETNVVWLPGSLSQSLFCRHTTYARAPRESSKPSHRETLDFPESAEP